MACRRMVSSSPLQLIGSKPLVADRNETYKINLKNWHYKYITTNELQVQIYLDVTPML
jgi:hypothetical protein